MLCKIVFSSDSDIYLPFSYNNIIQGVLYNFINEKQYADFMHNRGYINNKRIYKLFSFSKVLERPVKIDRQNKMFIFPKQISIYITSVNNEFFSNVINSIINIDSLRIGNNDVKINMTYNIKQRFDENQIITTKSPITIYSTMLKNDNTGEKLTYYYNPMEKDFYRLIKNNLVNKYHAIYDEELDDDRFELELVDKYKEEIIKYKGFVIKGYSGKFKISGNKKLIEMAFCAGLGGKNSQGFGLIVNEKEVI